MKKTFYLSLAICILSTLVQAQTPREKKFELYHGKPGITKKLSELQSAAQAAAKKQLRPFINPIEFKLQDAKKFKESLKMGGKEKEDVEKEQAVDDNSKVAAGDTSSLQKVWSNFLASTFEEFPYFSPPDPNGAVGTSQILVLSNNMLKVFNKKSVTDPPVVSYKGVLHTPEPAQISIPTLFFFSPILPDESYASDYHVRYDRLSKRWFIAAIEVNESNQNNYVLLAVSDGDYITDETSFIFYRFPSSLFSHSSNALEPFFDYPRLGIDKDAILIGGSEFFFHNTDCGISYDSLYSVGYAIDKKRLLRNGELYLYPLKLGSFNFYSGVFSGMYVPQGVYNDNPAAAKSFFAGISLDQNGLVLAALTYNSSGQLVDLSETTVPVQSFQFPRDITALGSPMIIDPLDTRLFEASIHKNKLTGKSSLWTAHAIGLNQSGGFVSNDDFLQQARTGSRWYEIEKIYTTPKLLQAGTIYDPLQASGRRAVSYFNPSITVNGQGHAVLGGTTSAYNQYLNAFISGRYYADDKGSLGPVQKVTATRAIYALNWGYYVDRWGDYSQTVVDPMDDQTLWTFQEYATSDDNFGVRAIQVKAPPPATPLPLDAISNKNNVWVTVKGVSVDHSGFFDPGSDKGGPGYNRLSVKITGGLLASNIKLVSPTEIRFWLNARNKPAGKYTVVITNPDGQIVTTEIEIVATAVTSVTATNLMLQKEVQEYSTSSSVTPNPTPGNFTMQINAAKNWIAHVVLMDVTGKQLSVSTYSLGKGLNQFSLSLAGYDNGTYLAAVYNQDHVLIALQKIVKQ